jgi:predicted nucleic acid-binding protein
MILYAALAELRRSEFWTADRRFYRAARDTLGFVHFIEQD